MIRLVLTASLMSAVVMGTAATTRQATMLPARLDDYIANFVRPSASERRQILEGRPVARLLPADPSKEVSVFGIVWIQSSIARYLELARNIEELESGKGFNITRRISSPPRLADFDAMRVTPEDFADLRTCRVGDCQMKLGEETLQHLRSSIDWSRPNAHEQVNRLMRQAAFDYVTGYLEGGNERLATYRDGARPTFVADEFREMVAGMPLLTTFMPSLKDYLLGFPAVAMPDATSFLYWQETDFGLKPTVRISHVTMRETSEGAFVASKMLYATHYFWTGIELRLLVPDPARGQGFWFVTINRSRSDGLRGFVGRFVRGRAQNGAINGARALLETTRRRLETN
jgi:hypothetical protein